MIAEHSSKIMKTNLFLLLAVGGKKKKKTNALSIQYCGITARQSY